jgi:MoaA/NifB/PqqE/SkfB family radical SAM enzyme
MSKPLLLHYYLTNRCNSRCSFCSIWQEHPKLDALVEDVLRNLGQARALGCRFVDFTGGEPLMHPELPLFLQQAKKLGYTTSVTTNCLLFEKRAPELAGLIDLPHFSLDAGTAALHDQLHGVKSFEAVARSIPVALSHRIYPDLLYTYGDQNIGQFEEAYQLARRHRLIILLDPLFDLSGVDQVSPATHARARRLARQPGVYLNTAHLTLRTRGGNNPERPSCRAVSAAIVILPDNRLALPCYHHAHYPLPIENSLDQTRRHPQFAEALRSQGRYHFCEGCHINCYFDPSYTYQCNVMLLQSLWAKWRYAWQKYVVYRRPLPIGGSALLSDKRGRRLSWQGPKK